MWNTADFMQPAAQGPGWLWDQGGWWWWMFGAHGLFWLLLIGLVVAVLALTLRLAARDGPARPGGPASGSHRPPSDARGDLDARFARGEIDSTEYLARHRQLP